MRRKENLPQFKCNSCTHCTNCRCQVFQRHVDVNENKCFYHSKYAPQMGVFRVNPNLQIIIEAEQKAKEKHYKGWLREAEMMRKETLKQIQKEKGIA